RALVGAVVLGAETGLDAGLASGHLTERLGHGRALRHDVVPGDVVGAQHAAPDGTGLPDVVEVAALTLDLADPRLRLRVLHWRGAGGGAGRAGPQGHGRQRADGDDQGCDPSFPHRERSFRCHRDLHLTRRNHGPQRTSLWWPGTGEINRTPAAGRSGGGQPQPRQRGAALTARSAAGDAPPTAPARAAARPPTRTLRSCGRARRGQPGLPTRPPAVVPPSPDPPPNRRRCPASTTSRPLSAGRRAFRSRVSSNSRTRLGCSSRVKPEAAASTAPPTASATSPTGPPATRRPCGTPPNGLVSSPGSLLEACGLGQPAVREPLAA